MENIFQHLPNELIMRIIREADGGRHTHKKKMKENFEMILGIRPIYYYEDGCGNQCPQFVYEDWDQGEEMDEFMTSDEEED
jgi:hypothetical protein